MTWMGHKRIDETMLYVNFAGAHLRPIPPTIITAPQTELDPDRASSRCSARVALWWHWKEGAKKKCCDANYLRSSDDRTRTCGPVINSHLLYQLSYVGMFNDG